MKIVFFNKTLISGGIEKCIENLSKYIYKDYKIEIVYTDTNILDQNIVNILSKYAYVHQINYDEIIDCDICIWCYLYFDYYKLKKLINAKKYIAWIHSMPRILPNCLLDNNVFVKDCSNFICVSNAVKNNLNINKHSQVIHNFIEPSIEYYANNSNPFISYKNKLKLTVVSRLSKDKGFNRLFEFCNNLEKQNIDYKLLIVGKGRAKELEIKQLFSNFNNVEFVGYKENPYPYIKHADYLLQLSDDESWCNSITESKILNTPVIVTNFESSKEQIKTDYNGIIINLNNDNNNYEDIINRMISQHNKYKTNLNTFKYVNEINKWLDLLK